MNKDFLVFEADTGKDYELARWLVENKIPMAQAYGCYKGLVNACFITDGKYLSKLWTCEHMARQESILHVDDNLNASLIYLDGTVHEPQPIGKWKVMPEKYALQKEGWTFFPALGSYYVAE